MAASSQATGVKKDPKEPFFSCLGTRFSIRKENAFLFFGVNDKTHEIEGTKFDYRKSVNGNEPLTHFIARQLNPSVAFQFDKFTAKGKRIVILIIPASKNVPTSFDHSRYLRIGSSKENMEKYPEWESKLFSILSYGEPTILTVESAKQDLAFKQLFGY